jgi:MFS transporter, ACS family, hexuronate transporter
MRWKIAILVSSAIAISYFDRQTLPVAIKAIQVDIPISNQAKAALDSLFLVTYGLMYLGGGWMIDRLGTKKGFTLTMIFWSIACASHGFARGLVSLATSRLLLGMGEGGGFPAATRVVSEWFSVKERSIAMGIVNGGTAVGGVAAPPLIAWVLLNVGWGGVASWRWMFFLAGAVGLLWVASFLWVYRAPSQEERVESGDGGELERGRGATIGELLRYPEMWGVVMAKFLSDAAWFFYLFWLPKYLYDARGFDIKQVGALAWLPHVAAGVGCICGGVFSSYLLKRGASVDRARKFALGASAVMMPLLIAVPYVPIAPAIVLFCVGYFGQQSWSTLVMILPTDLFAKESVGTAAGLVGFGGAMGGVCFGQLAGWLLDHGFGYRLVFGIAGSLHVLAFGIILLMAPSIRRLGLPPLSLKEVPV